MLVKTLRIAGLLAILACTGPLAEAATLLDSLVWEDGVLILGFDGPFESRSLVMEEPDRIVLDFPGVRTGLAQAAYPGSGALSGIRIGQNEPEEPGGLKTRVVLDLALSQNFLTEAGDRSLRLVLSPASGQAAKSERNAPSAAPAKAAASPSPVERTATAAPAPSPVENAASAAPALSRASLIDMSSLPLAEALPEVSLPASAPSTPAADLGREDPAPPAWEAAAASHESAAASQEFARLSDGEREPSAADPATLLFASDPVFVASDPFEMSAAEQPVAESAAPTTASAAPESRNMVEVRLRSSAAVPEAPPLVAAASGGSHVAIPSAAASENKASAAVAAQATTPSAATTAPSAAVTKSAAPDFGRELTLAAGAEEIGASPVQAPAFTRTVQVAQTDKAPVAKTEKTERAPDPLLLSGQLRAKADDALITLEMRGAEFRTLLHAFSEFAGVNIISGKEVQGKVSVHLTSVPWRKALAAVCSANGYTVKEEYGVLRVAPRGSLLQEEMELLTAERKRSEYRPLETQVIKLSYAVAGELTDPLSKMLSERGKMDVDDRTNAILITDLPENVQMVVSLAQQLDLLMPQVEITARIVDLDYRASRDLGVRWDALNIANNDIGLAGNGSVDGSFSGPVADVKLGVVRSWGELNVALQALEQANKANIISTPRVTTMDNREANILVGKKIPLIVADEAGNAITQLTTIGIKMVVTPHINPDGKIMMQVLTEVSDLASEATVQGGVIITTSESKTNVMVDNGSTAVIAGLIKSSDSSLNRDVPFLGKLPILGHLFGYSNQNDSKRELIIFITPRIVDPSANSTEFELRDQGYTLPLGG